MVRKGDPQLIERLTAIIEQMNALEVGAAYREFLPFNRLDQQFHLELILQSENSFLIDAYEGMHCHLHNSRFYHVRGSVDKSDAMKEHRHIVEAIRTWDVERVIKAIEVHVRGARKRLVADVISN